MRRIVPPTTLPRRCRAHDFILHNEQLIVGGSSNSHESIWVLDYTHSRQPTTRWNALDIPIEVRKSGKAIDLLYVLNQMLVAVDNVISPKWFVFYALRTDVLPKPVGIHPLRVESAFERVYHGAEGDKLYAFYSRGAGGNFALSYVHIYFKDELARSAAQGTMAATALSQTTLDGDPNVNHWTLPTWQEDSHRTRCWHFKTNMSKKADLFADLNLDALTDHPTKHKRELPGAGVYAMMFCKEWLFLAMGAQGVWGADTTSILHDRNIGPAASFQRLPSKTLTNVSGFSRSADDEAGIFAVGHNIAGVTDYEWHDLTFVNRQSASC